MIPVPSPLHPALVHFPIVLILIGTMVVAVSIFLRRWQLPWIAAGLLMLGAVGAIAAAWTGGQEEESVGEISASVEGVLDAHEEWGERTRNAAIIAALLALGAASASRLPAISRGLTVMTVVAAMVASYCVAQAGHYGGQLVYKYGVGVNTAAGAVTETGRQTAGDDD